jgi:uncharacterized protein
MEIEDFTHILEEIVNRLKQLDPEQIIPLGSAARGEQDRFSDVDLIVVYQTSKRFLDRLGELYSALGNGIPADVDMFGYTPEELDRLLEERAFIQDAELSSLILFGILRGFLV